MAIKELLKARAADVAGGRVPSLDKDYSLMEALRAAEKASVDRVVLTEEGRARGIMTFRDVIFKLATVRTKRAYIGGLHASNFMSEPLVSVEPEASLREALERM